MDAFLKPSENTDLTGALLAMKTEDFYKNLQKKLTRKGLVVFNLNPASRRSMPKLLARHSARPISFTPAEHEPHRGGDAQRDARRDTACLLSA